MVPEVRKATRSTDYGFRGECDCCIGRNHMPHLQGEKKWQRYTLPLIIGATLLGAVLIKGCYDYKHRQKAPPVSISDISNKLDK